MPRVCRRTARTSPQVSESTPEMTESLTVYQNPFSTLSKLLASNMTEKSKYCLKISFKPLVPFSRPSP